MNFLIANVFSNDGRRGFADRKGTVPALPCELGLMRSTDPFRRTCFHISHKIRKGEGRIQPSKDMGMLGHSIDLNWHTLVIANDAAQIFV